MKPEQPETVNGVNMARRSFLRYAGVGAVSAGVLAAAACQKDHKINLNNGIDIGSGDIGILNYAYALEQLEAAFYTQVIKTPYTGMSSKELSYLTAIRDHEICHREFFKKAIGASAIVGLTVDFSSIDFTSRASVLGSAKAFEDTGVTAYDGVGYMIQNPAYLTLAGKIVSVEARHAALISDLLIPGSFVASDVVDPSNGLNKSALPKDVLPIANKYLKTKVNAAAFGYIAS
jgi:hypothetical protein